MDRISWVTFDFLKDQAKRESIKCSFHNLKFDGEFLLHELFRQGFTHNEDNRKLRENEFSTLISDTRLFYEIRICYGWREKNNRTVTIQDSLKVLPFSVDKVAKAFNLPIDKLTIDYEAVRAKDYTATDE